MNQLISKSDKFTTEYCISIVRIGEVKPIENSDFLGQTVVNGESIVIRKDQVKEGDVLFYASNECALNKDFLARNNLFEWGERDLNDNYDEVEKVRGTDEEKAKRMVGFFNKHGRVRMIRLRGVPSMGYLFGLPEMAKYCPKAKDIDLEDLLGEDFDTVDGELFVKAYVPFVPQRRGTRRNNNKRQKKIKRFDRLVKNEFLLHYDTDPLPKYIHEFKPDDEVTITVKRHGCVERNTIVNTMEYGDKTIGEIVDNKIECHIKAYDTGTKQMVFVPISQFYKIPNDGIWYEIELSNGKKIKITGNNPVWCENLQCYRRVEELKGDEILIFDNQP